MQFVAIDVETANPDLSSICQVGIAVFRDGTLTKSWETLVDPEDYFCEFNVAIHGIDERSVFNAPRWPQVAESIRSFVDDSVIVSHTPFDRAATSLACSRHGVAPIECRWLDTARVVRRAWPDQFGAKGYGLANVAKFLEIEFDHHNAVEDARTAGEILCRASAHTGLSVDDWLQRVQHSIHGTGASSEAVTREGSAEGPLFGNVAVFTGALHIPRREAADLAARAGCDVASSVTKKTTLLIVGDQDITKLAGKSKSSKHLRQC
ncbi:MAG: hypothetical protein KDA57_22920, partial [Planctomycetales bacterium]|nr:hypothetical protein [Planctomycetales bacterium]